jgi:hypothetical protein
LGYSPELFIWPDDSRCAANRFLAILSGFFPHSTECCIRRKLWDREGQVFVQHVGTLLPHFTSFR